MKIHLFAFLACAVAPVSPARGQGLVISEFMAMNERTLQDDDGDFSDWIELHNPGTAAVNLAGYHLSDRADHLQKWRFPAFVLPPGGYLLVFASEKNRASTDAPFHTNFKLTGEREFLGLSDPQGNLVHGFSPSFPVQFPSISYGLSQPSAAVQLLSKGAGASFLVPASGVLGTTWTSTTFNDASWTRGPTGVGYDTGADYGALIGADIEAAMMARNASVYLRLPFNVPDPAVLDSLDLRVKYDDGFVAYLNGQEVARRNAPASAQWNSAATAAHGQPVTGTMGQDFDAAGTAYVLTAHGAAVPPQVTPGGPAGAFLRLMPDNTADLSSTVGFDRTFGPAEVVTIEFDYRMPVEAGHTGCCGERADGFGAALISTVEYGASGPGPFLPAVAWERPAFPDAFAVGFDIFDGTGAENTISLHWNGVSVAATRLGAFQLNNGLFNRVRIEARKEGLDSLVSVRITPNSLGAPGATVPVFTDLRVPGMNPFDARLAFGGRTGGAYTALDLDNVRAVFSPASPEIAYEEIDLAAHRGKLRAGSNVLAIHGLNRTAGDADFLILPELSATDFGGLTSREEYFTQPSPDEPNHPGLPGVAAEPQLSRQSGAYTTDLSLSLTVAPGTAIRYTVNGTEPTETSTLYSSPIAINRTTVVRARGFRAGLLPSRSVEGIFFRLDAGASRFASNLPLILLDTFGQGIGQSGFTSAAGLFIDTFEDMSVITDLPQASVSGGLKMRGSSSLGFPKKQFAFEVWDAARQDRAVSIFGFPEESDYIIYGPYTDKTLMRDVLSYGWSNEIGRWAPRTRFAEVFLKSGAGATLGMADYVGVYALIEKIKRDQNRVDLRNLIPSDESEPAITGGYILKKDRLDPGDVGFRSSRGHVLAYVDPKEQEITPAQAAYIKGYLDDFETVLYGPAFQDPVDGYAAYIDVDSFIDHHILVEMTKNIDGFRLSTFMFKDRGGKLCMGPIWDYNLCLGNADYLQGWEPAGWYNPQLSEGDYPWWRRLFQDPEFSQRYIDRWSELRRRQFLTSRLLATVDGAALLLDDAQVRNYQRWPILGVDVWPNWFVGQTYYEEVDWMKGWLTARLDWIDSNYLAPPRLNQDGGVIAPGFALGMSAPSGTIYYTLDGADPRLPGGEVSPTASRYGGNQVTTLVSSNVTPGVRVLVPTAGTAQTWNQTGFDDRTWTAGSSGVGVGYETQTGYEALIDLDVRAMMEGVNASIYIRIPFTVADPAAFDSLTLRMMYDDGYVAYLNGQQVASGNPPAALAWNAGAPGARNEALAVAWEDRDITNHLPSLRQGANVLAIHGLNAGAASSDLLIRPQLIASSITPADPTILAGATRVVARTWLDDRWSGPTRASFVLDRPLPLRITEMMYHPQDPPAGSIHDADDFEFLEIQNIGSVTASLLGARFRAGIEFEFSLGQAISLNPGEMVLVVKNREAFESRYGAGLNVAGEYRGNLENDGESIILVDGRGQDILAFDYDDLWYSVTDGAGYSLNIIDPAASPPTWNQPSSWRPSGELDGSPGEIEIGPPPGGFQRPGDANQDSTLDVTDALAVLMRLFQRTTRPLPCGQGPLTEGGNLALHDVNGDQRVNISDPIQTLMYLFRQGPPPALGTACVRIPDCPEACLR